MDKATHLHACAVLSESVTGSRAAWGLEGGRRRWAACWTECACGGEASKPAHTCSLCVGYHTYTRLCMHMHMCMHSACATRTCMLSLYRLDCVMFCLVAIDSRMASWKVVGSWM